MSVQDRTRWDKIYRTQSQQPYPAPDPLLLQYTPLAHEATANEPARALDLAAGLGQNGIWLAEQGYLTDVVDISRVALSRARAEMGMRNLRNVNLLQRDLDTLELEVAHYDLVAVFRYLKRHLFPIMKYATKPRGRIIYETYNVRYLDVVPEFNRAFLLEVGELLRIFSDWHVLHYEEQSHRAQIVAVRIP